MEVHNPESPLGRRLVGATNTVRKKGITKGARTTFDNRCGIYHRLSLLKLNIVLAAALSHILVTIQNTTSLLPKGFLLLKPPFPQRLTRTMLCHKHRPTILEHFWQVWRNENHSDQPIVDVRESSDNIIRSATVKIGDKTYDRPIQRLYELEGWDQGQSTNNKLLHLIDSDTPSKDYWRFTF